MLLCHKYFGGAEVTIGAVISHAWVRLPRRSRMDEERRLKSDFESERGELERQYKQRLQQVGGGSTGSAGTNIGFSRWGVRIECMDACRVRRSLAAPCAPSWLPCAVCSAVVKSGPRVSAWSMG